MIVIRCAPYMVIQVVEFSKGGYKIRKIFAQESTYPKDIFDKINFLNHFINEMMPYFRQLAINPKLNDFLWVC